MFKTHHTTTLEYLTSGKDVEAHPSELMIRSTSKGGEERIWVVQFKKDNLFCYSRVPDLISPITLLISL
jgi:hypothetical protein